MQNSTQEDTQAWYRQFWPWFIMVPPVCAILGSAITIWLALSNPPQLAVADYSRIEEINAENRQLTEAANAMGLTALMQLEQFDGSTNRYVSVTLSRTAGAALPGEILLVLTHATKPEFDRSTLLVLDGNRYRGSADFPAGKYNVQLEDVDRNWRLSGQLYRGVNSLSLGSLLPESLPLETQAN